jgi:signal transduction histidine kinase
LDINLKLNSKKAAFGGIRSIFNKLMLAYLIAMLIMLIMMSLLMSNFLREYYLNQKEQQLLNGGQDINQLAAQYLLGYIDEKYLNFALSTVDKTVNASIWFVDNRGYVWAESGFLDNSWRGVQLTGEDVKKVLSGETITKIGKFDDRFSTPMLTVGMPIKMGRLIMGAVFMHSPLYEINMALESAYRFIWLSLLISASVATILIYWISQRISQPLIEMSDIAKSMSKGDFSQKATVSSKDEVGQLATSFNKMAEALENLEDMRRGFVSSVSHELKSPLTSIRGFVQGILDGTIPPEEQAQYLTIVLEETDRLNKIIKELLELSRMESSQFQLTMSNFDVNELIRRVLLKQEKRIEQKELDVQIDFEQDRCMVEADRDRIEEVLINLIDNAIKFTPEKGHLIVSTRIEGNKVYISVSDSGIGISEEDMPHIWERFYTADKSRASGSTGLGLSIVKRIIEQHRQSIWVKSVPGQGTTFTFTLNHIE